VNFDFLQQRLRYLQIKTIGVPVLYRLIEWPMILEWLSPRRSDRILDVACGIGQLTFRISTYGCDAHGLDVSSRMIYGQRLASFWGVECAFVRGTAERLPYADACFDRVVCSSSLEHFKDDIGALREMNRVLVPNGTLVLTVDSFSYPIDNACKQRHARKHDVQHYYDKRELLQLFAEAGFDMVRSKYLMHSQAAHYFIKKAIARNYSPFGIHSLVAYPFVFVGDRLSSEDNGGFSLLAEGRKALASN
jgi:ubiquinone/menaquinone biosynthesis C-methylase UbiE